MNRSSINLDGMTSRQDFLARVQQLAEGTPYAVTETPEGFDVAVDFSLEKSYAVMDEQKISKAYTHRVMLDEPARGLTITDDVRTVTWEAGVNGPRPILGGSVSRSVGRTIEFGSERTLSHGGDGSLTNKVVYDYTSEEGRNFVTKAAAEQGWDEKMATTSKIGLYVGIGAIGLVVILGVIALIIVFIR